MPDLTLLEWTIAVAVGVVSVARTARLITHDDFPPAHWLRVQWLARTSDDWGGLITCPFCLSPYLMAGQMTWFYFTYDTPYAWVWWVPNVWWALSYLPAILVSYDEGP